MGKPDHTLPLRRSKRLQQKKNVEKHNVKNAGISQCDNKPEIPKPKRARTSVQPKTKIKTKPLWPVPAIKTRYPGYSLVLTKKQSELRRPFRYKFFGEPYPKALKRKRRRKRRNW